MTSSDSSGKILIVDDNSANLKILYTYLQSEGFEVLVAEDGTRALEVVFCNQPELILLDVMMPDMDGFEVCRSLKKDPATREIPIIFLTALSETVNKVKGLNVGGVDYITQPIEHEEIVARVQTHLSVTRTQKKLQQQNQLLQTEIARRKKIQQELKQSQQLLQENNDNLEQTVAHRTAELARSNQELEYFAYLASHDLRQPIRKIRMCAEYIAEEYQDCFDEEGKKYLNYIFGSTDRMYLLIDDLLAYSRVGKKKQKRSQVDLNHLIRETIDDLSLAISEKQAQIEYHDLPTIQANPREIRQLLQNLLSNALKFSKSDRKPVVAIDAVLQESHWLIKLQDNGIGFDPQFSEKVFQMFQRLHHQSEYEGTGIGLAICHKVIDSHGGKIWVESQEGVGTTFFFTLPVESEESDYRSGSIES